MQDREGKASAFHGDLCQSVGDVSLGGPYLTCRSLHPGCWIPVLTQDKWVREQTWNFTDLSPRGGKPGRGWQEERLSCRAELPSRRPYGGLLVLLSR